MENEKLVVRGARVHNLQDVTVEIPRDRLTVLTGLSGSGKSSLAFDTIYAEGQRRYVESLSAYARQFLGLMEKPDVDVIEGLSPAISIEQKTAGHNPRSTVGTVTEIYDYLRLLWARAGTPHCPVDGSPIQRQSASQIADLVLGWPEGTRIEVAAPLIRGRKGEFKDLFEAARKQGFVRVRVDGEVYELTSPPKLNRRKNHDVSLLVDRLSVRVSDRTRLHDSIETALRSADGLVEIVRYGTTGKAAPKAAVFSERFACAECGYSLPELEPRQFSFNSPYGACPDCSGLGTTKVVSQDLVLADPSISILEGVVLPWGDPSGYIRKSVIPVLSVAFGFDPAKPWGTYSKKVQHQLMHGDPSATLSFSYGGKGSKGGKKYEAGWEGILANAKRRYVETSSDAVRSQYDAFMIDEVCPECSGQRLKKESLSVLVAGRTIGEVMEDSVDAALKFFQSVPIKGSGSKSTEALDPEVSGPIFKEVTERLQFLRDVGLGYLTLGRSAQTLSGGEAQRIRLATQIGSRLVGVLYILDEPSIGLHSRDNRRLLDTL
ncbi:MAG: excinuclease ABC subunit UvrA, partial [Gemmatimonadota bacterium]|nr:excinuclease ABC subunit UvrA [Gemmatimonadota bacterium]